ncbi:MAG: DsbA family protein [Anaerolineales bacterium]
MEAMEEERDFVPAAIESPTAGRDDEGDVISFRRSHFYAAIVPVAFVLGIAAGYLMWGRADEPVTVAAVTPGASGVANQQKGAASRFNVSVDDDPAVGVAGAPVTIIEFSDFECPFCGRFHDTTFTALLQRYPDQILFVYRDFPLTSIHPNAQRAAEAAQCANEQGQFWAFHDLLFRNQQHLGNADLYTEAAQALSLEMDAFNECVANRRYEAEVTADYNAARALGITGTPTFFINGRPLVGAQPLEAFVSIIDEELAALGE